RESGVEGPTDAGVNCQHHVEKHSHPCRGHMYEEDSIGLALLKVSRCDKEPNVQADDEKNRRRDGKEGNHFACEWVEVRRRCVFVPIDSAVTHEFFAPSQFCASECVAVTIAIPRAAAT